jgi:hypothetical protein
LGAAEIARGEGDLYQFPWNSQIFQRGMTLGSQSILMWLLYLLLNLFQFPLESLQGNICINQML